MSDEKITRSEQKETFWTGTPYTQHYDEDDQKDGWSEADETFLGRRYTQRYDREGERAGTDDVQETFWGDTYVQHYDEDGNEAGHSEEKADFWGRTYTQHFDEEGNEIGQTDDKETFFGKKYEEHRMKEPPPQEAGRKKNPLSWLLGWIKMALGLGIIVLGLFVISAIIVTLPLWGGMILVSSIATVVFAEALKKRAGWALSMQQRYGARSIWLGPVVAAGCAALTLLIMAAAGVQLATEDVLMFFVFAAFAFWLSRRIASSIMRWRMAATVKR